MRLTRHIRAPKHQRQARAHPPSRAHTWNTAERTVQIKPPEKTGEMVHMDGTERPQTACLRTQHRSHQQSRAGRVSPELAQRERESGWRGEAGAAGRHARGDERESGWREGAARVHATFKNSFCTTFKKQGRHARGDAVAGAGARELVDAELPLGVRRVVLPQPVVVDLRGGAPGHGSFAFSLFLSFCGRELEYLYPGT